MFCQIFTLKQEEKKTGVFHVETIRLPEDSDFALSITDSMNWGMVREDLDFMTQLEPEGCFVLFRDSRRIGLASTISYGDLGWLGNVIVNEDSREQGAGSFLVKECLKFLSARGAKTIGLYAYISKIPFYQRLGFKSDVEFVFLKGRGFSLPIRSEITRVSEEEVPDIIALDQEYAGASREKLLKSLLVSGSNQCYTATRDGKLLGYVAATTYDGRAELGPLVCLRQHREVALDLLKTMLTELDSFDVSLCIPRGEDAICSLLLTHGFREDFRLMRMFHGRTFTKDCIYLAESLERG